MTKLSVNINKIATIRNARGNKIPNLVEMALDIEKFGGQGITVHPRPDERHIRYQDVYNLAKVVTTEFNIEGYPNPAFIELVLAVKPTQVTLVPDSPDVLTSNAGWDIIENEKMLKNVISTFKKTGIRTSVFMEPSAKDIALVPRIGADRIELYTEVYARNYKTKNEAILPFIEAAKTANELNIGINAGHDLDLKNLAFFQKNIPNLLEVSIGHALISDALYFGMEKTIGLYLEKLKK